MKVARREVVLVHFPFASGKGAKVRPALVVQADHNNARMTNTIIVQITTNLRRVAEPTQLLIDPATSEGGPSGLLSPSAVTCENIATVHESVIVRTIGRLPPSVVVQIDDCLKAAFGIP